VSPVTTASEPVFALNMFATFAWLRVPYLCLSDAESTIGKRCKYLRGKDGSCACLAPLSLPFRCR